VDRNVRKSKKVLQSLSKKGSNKKTKDTSVEIRKHTGKIDSMLNASSCSKVDLGIQDQFDSDLPSSLKQPKLNDEEPPKDFSFFDARQQVQIEGHMKQHLVE